LEFILLMPLTVYKVAKRFFPPQNVLKYCEKRQKYDLRQSNRFVWTLISKVGHHIYAS